MDSVGGDMYSVECPFRGGSVSSHVAVNLSTMHCPYLDLCLSFTMIPPEGSAIHCIVEKRFPSSCVHSPALRKLIAANVRYLFDVETVPPAKPK